MIDDIRSNGFVVVKNFLDATDVSSDFITHLKLADKFIDGAISDIPDEHMSSIKEKISRLVPNIANALNISISPNNFGYCAIRVNQTSEPPLLRKPFNVHQDPKVAPGGVLNWHLDHFSYYLYRDHVNWLICYMPIFKPKSESANLAIIPTSIVKKLDPNLYQKIQGRGAMRFRCAEPDTLEWFIKRFPNLSPQVGDWFAIDDDDDSTMGFKVGFDLEAHKVVPQLDAYDLLIMRADVIHRTNDASTDRISVRCDSMPLKAPDLGSLSGLLGLTLRFPFMGGKRQYNLRKWLKSEWNKRLNHLLK